MGGGVSYEEMVQHIVSLGDKIKQLQLDNATLQAQMIAVRSDQQTAGTRDYKKSALRDVKKLYPEKFHPKTDAFATWSEDFLRWIRAEDESKPRLGRGGGAHPLGPSPAEGRALRVVAREVPHGRQRVQEHCSDLCRGECAGGIPDPA